MHSNDKNNNLGKETISLNEEGQELKSTDSRQPQKNVVGNRKSIMYNKDASKEQCISNNYKVDEMHDSSQDSIEKLKGIAQLKGIKAQFAEKGVSKQPVSYYKEL